MLVRAEYVCQEANVVAVVNGVISLSFFLSFFFLGSFLFFTEGGPPFPLHYVILGRKGGILKNCPCWVPTLA